MQKQSYVALQHFQSQIYSAITLTKLSELLKRYSLRVSIDVCHKEEGEFITLRFPEMKIDNVEALSLELSLFKKNEKLFSLPMEMPIGDYSFRELESMLIGYFQKELKEHWSVISNFS